MTPIRVALTSLLGALSAVALGIVLIPIRSHISIATAGLILVVPVVVGVRVGGYVGGLVSVAAGFLVFDFLYIPPYYTLNVGAGQNWVALGVYVIVMFLVAQVVARLQATRREAERRAQETQKIFELSELLVEDRSLDEMLETIVSTTRRIFGLPGVSLLLPESGRLTVAASAGEPISESELSGLATTSGQPVPVGTGPGLTGQLRAVALSASGRPVGILAVRGMPSSEADRALFRTFANHAALALERSRLREQALRSELLEEADRVRDALLGAVSHDLRTPLATMKIASSSLLDPSVRLSDADTQELYGLIDMQTDRLNRLVTSLLDVTRYQAGVLKLARVPSSVLDLVLDAISSIGPALADRIIDIDIPEDLPRVDCDRVLIGQVIVNLIDNADRHGPADTPITVAARADGDARVLISVEDHGQGVPRQERQSIFESFVGFDSGGRSGLGLSIAKTFVKAHGEDIWVEESQEKGARFVFSLRAVSQPSDR